MLLAHYLALFGGTGDGPEAEALREAFAIPNQPLGSEPDDEIRALVAWWWWTSWAASTLRPDDTVTYTNNWPHEPLVGQSPEQLDLYLDLCIDSPADCRHRCTVLVLSARTGGMAKGHRTSGRLPGQQPYRNRKANRLHARDRQVHMDRQHPACLADPAGCGDRPLCRGRPRILRHTALGICTLCPYPDLACTACSALDCHGLAWGRSLPGTDDCRPRAAPAASRGQYALDCPGHCGAWLTCR